MRLDEKRSPTSPGPSFLGPGKFSSTERASPLLHAVWSFIFFREDEPGFSRAHRFLRWMEELAHLCVLYKRSGQCHFGGLCNGLSRDAWEKREKICDLPQRVAENKV